MERERRVEGRRRVVRERWKRGLMDGRKGGERVGKDGEGRGRKEYWNDVEEVDVYCAVLKMI